MRILFVSPRQGWPPISGSKLREYHGVRALGERCDVSYVFFREPELDLATERDLPFCREIIPVPRPRSYSPDRVIRGLAGRWPLPILNYTTAEMSGTLQRLLETRSFDAVYFDGVHLAAYAPQARGFVPASRVFFNWHNIESEGIKRFAEVTPSKLKALYARLTAPRLARVERELLAQGYGNIVCSEREQRQLTALVPSARVAVIENGVDAEQFRNLAGSGNRHRIVFVGLMSYHANIDAAVWFANQVWPALRERFPDKVLTIVGANPAPPVLALRDQPGVEVTGTVPDVKPYYTEAFAAVAPLRTGAGTRLKILEAMAAGTPAVSTAIGAEGLEVTPGREFLVAESPEDWLRAFTVLQDEQRRCALVHAGRELVERRYDWKIIRETLYNTCVQWLQESAPDPAASQITDR